MTTAMKQTSAGWSCFYQRFLLLPGRCHIIVLGDADRQKTRFFLTGNSYRAIIRFLGLSLIILAGKLFYDGLKLLQIPRKKILYGAPMNHKLKNFKAYISKHCLVCGTETSSA